MVYLHSFFDGTPGGQSNLVNVVKKLFSKLYWTTTRPGADESGPNLHENQVVGSPLIWRGCGSFIGAGQSCHVMSRPFFSSAPRIIRLVQVLSPMFPIAVYCRSERNHCGLVTLFDSHAQLDSLPADSTIPNMPATTRRILLVMARVIHTVNLSRAALTK